MEPRTDQKYERKDTNFLSSVYLFFFFVIDSILFRRKFGVEWKLFCIQIIIVEQNNARTEYWTRWRAHFEFSSFLHRFVSKEGIRFHSWLSVEESLELEWKLFFHGCNCRRETDSNLISWNYSQWKVEFGTNFLVENRIFWNESLEQDGYISNISFSSFLLFFFYLFIDSYRELERNDSILRLQSPYRNKFGMKIIFRSYGASNESE